MELFTDCLREGAEQLGLALDHSQVALMGGHAQELNFWNKKINLTAIKTASAMAEKHFLDTICAQPLMGFSDSAAIQSNPSEICRIMDMGSGGGFPGIPLKILVPGLTVTLVDSVRKKVNFLNHVIRTLSLKEIVAVHSRVEVLAKDPAHASGYDAVIARGFADLESFVRLAEPMLKPGGQILSMKGDHALEEITPNLKDRFDITPHSYTLPFGHANRYLLALKRK
ncbi:MAG: 16S rRNA (guanine(527)-N(7))-methyltransferase RsmG [Desulfobacterales bacterium]|nr:MAG: 16S rRNA (guanine(527)-N(7))-methyltransferase RsmG [Desulfobacterales bacterium]